MSPVYNLPYVNRNGSAVTEVVKQEHPAEDRGIVSPFYSNGGFLHMDTSSHTASASRKISETLDQDPNHIEVRFFINFIYVVSTMTKR